MIRYKVNIMEELKKAGFSTYRLRKERIFSESTMQKFREGNTTISVASLSEVCHLLNCQPGNLLEFVPDNPSNLTENASIVSNDAEMLEMLGQIASRLDALESQMDAMNSHLNK